MMLNLKLLLIQARAVTGQCVALTVTEKGIIITFENTMVIVSNKTCMTMMTFPAVSLRLILSG